MPDVLSLSLEVMGGIRNATRQDASPEDVGPAGMPHPPVGRTRGRWALARCLAWLLLLLPVAGPALAQRPDRVLQEIERSEDEAHAEARRWAARQQLPLHIPQQHGGAVELVGVTGRRPTYLTTHNRFAASVTHTSNLYPDQQLSLALTGRGLWLGIWDAGHVRGTHVELAGRVTFGDDARVDNHATHVAGTLVASGVRPEARGMAYEAQLRSYDWTNDAAELANEAAGGLLVSNHSYGAIAGWFYGDVEGTGDRWYWLGDPTISTEEDYAFGWYDLEATQFDRVVHAHPYLLPVVAAGNDRHDAGPVSGTYRGLDASGAWQSYSVETRPRAPDGAPDGYDTIAGAGVAKNVLTVGSVGLRNTSARYGPSTFSSFGPLDDGRLKPDLVGYGESLLSSTSSGDAVYGRSSGTSMATPNVAGTALLLQQYHGERTGRYMRAATLKGLLLHTARDLELPGPDYRTGWGLLDAEAAARHIAGALDNPIALFEGTLQNGGTVERTVRVEGTGPLRVTLSWTDPPSTRLPLQGAASLDAARPHLRNDLDVRLVDDATGRVYLPYRPDPATPGTPAGTGDNTVDPVEQVYLAAPAGSTYTVVVSHKGTLVNAEPQPFSLIVSGAYDDYVPVTAFQLEAEASVETVVLRWLTRFERASGTFILERAPVTYFPDEGRRVGAFVDVGMVAAGGPSEQEQAYTFRDERFLAGRFVYRLVFADDVTRYTLDEIEVNVPAPDTYTVLSNYPNPFSDRTTLVLDLPREDEVRVEVFDALGRRAALVYEGTLPAGRHHLPLQTPGWAPGLYLARITTAQAATTHRLIVRP